MSLLSQSLWWSQCQPRLSPFIPLLLTYISLTFQIPSLLPSLIQRILSEAAQNIGRWLDAYRGIALSPNQVTPHLLSRVCKSLLLVTLLDLGIEGHSQCKPGKELTYESMGTHRPLKKD